jgi:RNA polymerase sigma-70 factor, ECF subfamily
MLRAGVLRVSEGTALWQETEARLRPFLARRVPVDDVDDVLQDVFLRMQRGLAGLRDEERFAAWLYQVARSAIADHGRARARHPLPWRADPVEAEPSVDQDDEDDGDEAAVRALSACVALFVGQLPSPYREAVTLVELEGLTAREAAELAGVTVSGMKSRVQRGRQRLRALFEDCCEIALDARGKVVAATPRRRCGSEPCAPAGSGSQRRRPG